MADESHSAHIADVYEEARRATSVPAAEPRPSVVGCCPACGSSSLFLADGGHVTCRRLECPNPTAAADILADGEVAHVVTFTAVDFTIRHPLVERLGDALMACELHAYCSALDGPPTLPGRYRVVPRRLGGWSWATLPPKPGESL